MKRIIVSVTSDLVTDQRVHKTCTSLHANGYNVLLVGRRKNDSLPLESRDYKTKRMKLLFEKGPLFYAEYNFRLFFFLLFHQADILLANDLDTLLPNFLVSRLFRKGLIYDNHEYYTGVPELQNRPFVKSIWKMIERFIFPRLSYVYTVNDSIAKLYHDEYKVPVKVVRNMPFLKEENYVGLSRPNKYPADKRIILYQGAGINIHRGVEEAIQAMKYVDSAVLVIVGGGDVLNALKTLVIENNLSEKVKFVAKQTPTGLLNYTFHADIGLSLDKNTNINYRFSLPNKLFDYIHAGLPVLGSRLPEVERIITTYNVGKLIDNHDPQHIASLLNSMLSNTEELNLFRQNCKSASSQLNWQNEEKVIIQMVESING